MEKINEEYNLFKHYGLVTQTLVNSKSQLKLNWHLKLFEMYIELIYT